MVRVNCPEPSKQVADLLAHRRRGRRGRPTRWESRNPDRVHADAEINNVLRLAFNGKCGYCEHLEANTIDHFWPRHPLGDEAGEHDQEDRTWDWSNFILACSVCQGAKQAHPPVNADGHWMVNPRTEEPLGFLRINTEDGKIYALPLNDETEWRGDYTIAILKLDQRPDLDNQRRVLYNSVKYLIYQIVKFDASEDEANQAWQHLQDCLDIRQPYLAVIQQLFTFPPSDMEPLIQRLYDIQPDSHAFFAHFRRTILLV